MSEMFGHTWLRDQGDEPNDTWIRGLSDLSSADLGCGLIACRDSGKVFPPTLPEFRAMCRPNHGLTAMERASFRACDLPALEDLSAKEERRQYGIEAIQKLREEMGL